MAGVFKVPKPKNEPIIDYAPGTPEREKLLEELRRIRETRLEIPLIIGGKEVKTDDVAECRLPHDHGTVIGVYHRAGEEEVRAAIEAAMEAREKWMEMPWDHRLAIFLKAAELMSKKYRIYMDAVVMHVHSKNPFQAEIDVAELIDFWRFNAYYAWKIYGEQPEYSPTGTWNRMEYRPLEGFIFAVPPFNFISIGGNLPTAPAMMGNVVLWKPSRTVVYSNYVVMKILMEAGLPAGVVNFVVGNSRMIGDIVFKDPNLAGVHFTGSTAVFKGMWKAIGENIDRYRTYPRIVGETGGKDFVFVHSSARVPETVTAIIRGAFEYQGQKCSAVSRAYIPESLWEPIWEMMERELKTIKMGPVDDLGNFVNAVIDGSAFRSIVRYIEEAKKAEEAEVIYGGNYDDSKGYFIEPTVIRAYDPKYVTMVEEIFGPVLTVYVYEDEKYEETLKLCDETSPYGLTGAVFATDREAIVKAERILRHAAGNFYINDKPTGAIVGQQPFGGSRASGTNDKAGSWLNLIRWVTPRTIKETFLPPEDYRYPFLGE